MFRNLGLSQTGQGQYWLRNESDARGTTAVKGKEFSHFQDGVCEGDAFLPLDAGCADVTLGISTTREASLRVRPTEESPAKGITERWSRSDLSDHL